MLVALARDQVVTDDVLGSCRLEIERILSNRLLAPVSSDAKKEPPLAPNSFPLPKVRNGPPWGGGLDVNY